jgi:SAM-dependent methyltransferase
VRCPICDGSSWKNVDELRLRKVGMSQCQDCGFISYPDKYKSEEEIKEYYKKDYRPSPQAGNLFTGERKLQYHAAFLAPLFEEWKKAGLEKPVIGEVGSAYGMFLNWIRQIFPGCELSGTELTESYRRVAFHEYGLKLTDELDKTKKYDMIASYHVLEHQMDPDKRLAEYAALLKDSGVFYLSLPIWFRDAGNSATGGFDIEYYWAEDHINCWSEEHLEYLIAKAGLEIIAKDTAIYGNTYLLKKSTKTIMKPKFEPKKYYDIAAKIFKAWQHIQENQTAMAIETYPNCPAAWINHYELNRAAFHRDRKAFDEFLVNMIEACPNSADTLMFAGDILTRYERYEESRELLTKALRKKSNNPTILMGIANTYRMQAVKEKDPEKKRKLLSDSINILRFTMSISTEMLPQCLSWCYQDQAMLPV